MFTFSLSGQYYSIDRCFYFVANSIVLRAYLPLAETRKRGGCAFAFSLSGQYYGIDWCFYESFV